MPKLSVYFLTTVFEVANTGPSIYAHYLWEAFKDDPNIRFHVVTTDSTIAHPQIHRINTVARRGPAYFESVGAVVAG